ncbi:MAG: hypothetical protein ACI9H8_002193 [Lysobacterales bacterium]
MVANVISGEPLHIELPTQGTLFRFAKLYANQAEEDAYFKLRYVHEKASFAGLWISLLAAAAFWVGIILLGLKSSDTPRQLPTILLTSGAVILALSVLLLGVSVVPASWLSLLIASAIAAWAAWQKRQFSNI